MRRRRGDEARQRAANHQRRRSQARGRRELQSETSKGGANAAWDPHGSSTARAPDRCQDFTAQAGTCNTSITIAIKDMTAASNASHDWSQGLALHVISENVSLLAFPRQHFPLPSIAHHFIIVPQLTCTASFSRWRDAQAFPSAPPCSPLALKAQGPTPATSYSEIPVHDVKSIPRTASIASQSSR
jgi:hypothetical protein